MAFVWSEEAIARLKARHGKGLSGSELARALGGGLTRSAIFGKLHRLGLSGAKSAETGRLVPRLAALRFARWPRERHRARCRHEWHRHEWLWTR